MNTLSHLAPAIITLVFICIVAVFLFSKAYFKHIVLVASANDEEGEEKLAKHLAHEAGGFYINVDEIWKSFLPAAKDMYKLYQAKKVQIDPK